MANQVSKTRRDMEDTKKIGKTQQLLQDEMTKSRSVAIQCVERDSSEYNMNHSKRGLCLIFYYSKFERSLNLEERKCAVEDAEKCETAFCQLGFRVYKFFNLRKIDFEAKIYEASKKVDHSDYDCLAVIYMSHGNYVEKYNREKLYTYDAEIFPEDLWKNFVGDGCPKLVGKPKLFFIQACRGNKTDKGVKVVKALSVMTDSLPVEDFPKANQKKYVLPSYADLLVMWGSYREHFAFKTQNNGITGSVFIHFLSTVLIEKGSTEDLFSLLLTVSRKVALEYESNVPQNPELDSNKQIPHIESTLIRNLRFTKKPESTLTKSEKI